MCAKQPISVLVWRAYKLPKMHQEKAINTAIELAKERLEDIQKDDLKHPCVCHNPNFFGASLIWHVIRLVGGVQNGDL
jgi:hypothetical protein